MNASVSLLRAAVLAALVLVGCSKNNYQPAAAIPISSHLPAPTPNPLPVALKSYPINLSPAIKVGQKFSYMADCVQSQQMHFSYVPGILQPENRKMAVHLEAEAEVLGIFSNGSVQKVALTVKAMTGNLDSNMVGRGLSTLPAAGTKIIAERVGPDKKITVDGMPFDPFLDILLGAVVPLGEEKHSDQELFGPSKSIAIGDTWSVNNASLSDAGFLKSSANLPNASGTMKLDAITGSGGGQIASVSGDFSLALKKAADVMTNGIFASASFGTVTGNIAIVIPAITTQGTYRRTMALTAKMKDSSSAFEMDEKTIQEITYH